MKTILLHIGYPKTGTTSLQWFLHTHRDAIREQGIYYPLTGQAPDHAHHGLAFALGAREQFGAASDQPARLFEALASEIDQSGVDTIVLSSEVFLANLERLKKSPEFASILQDRDVRVICFVRRQATFLESLYRQFIWDPNIRFDGDPAAFIDAYPMAGDYHGPLSIWHAWAGTGKIATTVYEQAQQNGGCIRTFCQMAGIDLTRLPPTDLDVRRNIAVASSAATGMMRAVNACAGLSNDERLEFTRRAIGFVQATGHLPLPKALFTPAEVAMIETRYLESNRRLAEEFVRQPLDGPWFPDRPGS
jgi:hypothetical protein